ncbi:hypothetical protein [Streptomyces griseorubiginosus]|uniref:hypothetical protein n=1 Tax=Streptomyces griseorubiginosus TaxID=67304 RepID=UPI000AA30A06|nr:hypothetical protein [Streptomyces griseorubiginosus]
MVSNEILGEDLAQKFLIPHLEQTERVFRSALRELDSNAECRITPAADLCFPHDVVRLAGGFATGCLVEWQCSVPVIPIDTTVNVDTSSVFWLSGDTADLWSTTQFDELRELLEGSSSYEWNFHKGNHFIASVLRSSDGQPGIVIHSNEKEFKYQYNGLMPVPGNWYMDDIVVHRSEGRYIRLLVGPKATLFSQIALDLEAFNVNRHRFLATMLTEGRAEIRSEYHKQHYYMPSPNSVAIGCYLCEPGEVVPVFSRPGADIHLFECREGGQNRIDLLNGGKSLIVPHGWGKTLDSEVSIRLGEKAVSVNGMDFEVAPKVTLGVHPNLIVRKFSSDPSNPDSIYARMSHHTPGTVVNSLRQVSSYSKAGFMRHDRAVAG